MAKTKPIMQDIDEVYCITAAPYKRKQIEIADATASPITNEIDLDIRFPDEDIDNTLQDIFGTSDVDFHLFKDGKPFGDAFSKEPHNKRYATTILLSGLDFGKYNFSVQAVSAGTTHPVSGNFLAGNVEFEIVPKNEATTVRLARPGFEETPDKELWEAIRSKSLNFREYSAFISKIMSQRDESITYDDSFFGKNKRQKAVIRSPFIGAREYNLLKFGTEFYMLSRSTLNADDIRGYLSNYSALPYYEAISDSLDDIENEYEAGGSSISGESRFKTAFFIELIWSYWMEQGMLIQAMNLICLRFQNIDNGNLGQLARFDLSPLRRLSHLFWDFIQDEQHRLSLPRRVREYDHEYGLALNGKAVPAFVPADSRSKFLEAFHSLLTTASIFFKEADDTTRIADAFPVLNSLKEVHLLLAEGNHNAYGNLTWTARHEMLMTQYIISREETRIFLGGRPMVPYPESWMDRIDTVRNMMGWGSTSITYFYDLAIHGEKILLAIRYGNWSDANMPAASAANWAIAFRDSIQKYIHGYRTVTGVDLSADSNSNNAARTIQPSVLIQRRVIEERARLRRA